nr:integrase core domain-containing protein [Desulfogranum marinum]
MFCALVLPVLRVAIKQNLYLLDKSMCNSYWLVTRFFSNWIDEYNRERPHESLGNLTPVEYLQENQSEFSLYGFS